MMNRKEHWRPQVHQRYTEETELPRYISPNCKMYFYKLQNVFVKITKCICPNYKMYLCIEHWRPQVHQKHTKENKLPKCICANCQNVVVQIAKMYLRKLPKYICANCKMFLSKILNVFVHRALAATGPSEAH